MENLHLKFNSPTPSDGQQEKRGEGRWKTTQKWAQMAAKK